MIMFTISWTTWTLDPSRYPLTMVPEPFSPGVPVSALPLALLATNRFCPTRSKAPGFANIVTLIGGERLTVSDEPGWMRLTTPWLETLTDVAPLGRVIGGSSGYPSE